MEQGKIMGALPNQQPQQKHVAMTTILLPETDSNPASGYTLPQILPNNPSNRLRFPLNDWRWASKLRKHPHFYQYFSLYWTYIQFINNTTKQTIPPFEDHSSGQVPNAQLHTFTFSVLGSGSCPRLKWITFPFHLKKMSPFHKKNIKDPNSLSLPIRHQLHFFKEQLGKLKIYGQN